jgi:hypothetical protein
MRPISLGMSSNTSPRPHACFSSPLSFHSPIPYTLYSGTTKAPYSWCSPTMSSLNAFQQAISNSSREDTLSGPEELSSNSNSPSSTAFTTDGRTSPCGSISATEGGRLSVASVPAACLSCVRFVPLTKVLCHDTNRIFSSARQAPEM